MVINTNMSAQSSARLLAESSQLLSKSLVRLSSGSKIVSPEDDVAGQAVSTRFEAQISRINSTRSNIANAISFSQTQDRFHVPEGQQLNATFIEKLLNHNRVQPIAQSLVVYC
jgi:flagellin